MTSIAIPLCAAGALGLVGWLRLRPVSLRPQGPAPALPPTGFPHDRFERLLGTFVDGRGRVDYARWHDDAESRRELDLYLAAIAACGPATAPERFPAEEDRLAYWLNAYNAFVIHGVLHDWPRRRDRANGSSRSLLDRLDFFWRLRFCADGRTWSLHALEHRLVRRRFSDPRVHFVLNCASGGCPLLRPQLPQGPELERYLAGAAADFVSDPANVTVDDERRSVTLSPLFEWYAADFANDLRRRGLPGAGDPLAYIALVAPDHTRLRIERARAEGYDVALKEHDWSLNDAGTADANPEAASRACAPEVDATGA
ncbi:MAG: DUF547 domain-containing protein [Planctomycetota bacterium]|jgi:hypothetical protein